ncbi:MAG TPA: sugar transferase [Candidatus Limnocylindrales bacterium]|nr:sugar transferase [Candidatus Limnocylindrales bacterium]
MLRYNLRYQIIIQCADALVVLAALGLSALLRLNIAVGMEAPESTFIPPPALGLLAVLIWLFAYRVAGVYAVQPGDKLTQVLWRLFVGQVFAVLMLMGVLYVGFRDFSRLQVAYILLLSTVGAFGVRLLLWNIQRRDRRLFSTARTVLIIGEGEMAQRAAQAVAEAREMGLALAGILAPDDAALETLPAQVHAHHAHEVLIAVEWFDAATSARVTHILHLLEAEPVNVRVVIDYTDLAYFTVTPEDFHGVTLLGLREPVLTPGERLLKRGFDLLFSALLLLLIWPVLLVVAVAIRLDSPGPAIFRQPRVGQHMKTFLIYKFRTMVDGADEMTDEQVRAAAKRPGDPRITRVGAFLRRTSLDELPQFFNVLKGDMSVVGPRPELLSLAAEYQWWQRKRFEAPQGITGWWQVNGRSDRPMQEHIEDDLYYVRNYSFWLDVQILFRTVAAVLTGRGAY